MKKNIFPVALLLITGLATSSCTSETTNMNNERTENIQTLNPESIELQALQAQIATFNTQKFGNNPTHTRGFWDKFRKFIAVSVCDAVGALFGTLAAPGAGTVAGAASFSAAGAIGRVDFTRANETNYGLSMNESSQALKDIVLSTQEEPCFEDSIGYYHNKLLLTLNEQCLLKKNMPMTEMVSLICEQAQTELPYTSESAEVENILKDENFSTFINNDANYINNYTSEDEYINALKNIYPEQQGELDIIYEFLKGLNNIDVEDNNGEYASAILELIEQSGINEDTKKHLRTAIIVGNASYNLWNVEK